MSSFTDPTTTSKSGSFGIRDAVLLLMVLLAIGGIAIMDFTESRGLWYWLAMVPIFGGLTLFMDWHRQKLAVNPREVQVRAQALHWLGTLLGVALVFLLQNAGLLDRTTTGFMALLVLGLSTLQAGFQTDWRIAVLGVLLLATLAAAVAVERYFWVMLVLAVIAIAIFRVRRH